MNEMLKDYIETKVYLLKHLVGITEFRNNDVVVETDDSTIHLKALSKNENGKYQWGARTQSKILAECEKKYKGGVIKIYVNWGTQNE